MAGSPSCSSASPSTSVVTMTTDLQETDIFSDDSGVDVKLQINRPSERLFLKYSRESGESSRRNKRKSTEPKKRKDVLLMKRFRWDTDDESNDLESKVEADDDDVFERERPSSGDSGCLMVPTSSLDLTVNRSVSVTSQKIPESLDLSIKNNSQTNSCNEVDKKKKPKQWRKSKSSKTDIKTEPLPTFRQSVIRKSSSHLEDSKETNSIQEAIADCHSNSSTILENTAHNYDGLLVDGQDVTPRSVGRPRNYKNMSRQRRIEANARERTRVHTISAAFENLRRAVPAYAHNQKLSKLAILRIASAYIVALACLNDQDYSQDQTQPNLSDCVEQCTRTIQAEGRSRRRSSKD